MRTRADRVMKGIVVFLAAILITSVFPGCATTTAPNSLSYSNDIVATVGQAITPAAPRVFGRATRWSVTPALPAGLTLDPATGVISGTPSASCAQTSFTVTAANSGGSATVIIRITINAGDAPSNLSYASLTVVATAGTSITSNTPTVTGSVTSWTVSPSLPTGINLNSTTGVISGTPAATSPATTYTITATNECGSITVSVQITVNPAPPSTLSYSSSSIVGTVGQAIATETPTVTGTVTSWTVNPSFPAGISLGPTTGVISGAPTTTSAQTTYTITASNVSGSTTTMVQITVNAASGNFTNFQAATVVLGQPDFVSRKSNQGISTGTAANALAYPGGDSVVANGILFVPDRSNNRVLGFNSFPSSNNASADFVLGQPNLTFNGNGNAANQMYGPQTVKTDGTKLFVMDRGNNRVLIWNTIPTTSGAAADVVVGQAAFGTSTSDCSATGLLNSDSIEVVSGKLIVGDTQNNRVLIWNAIPTTNGAAPDLVLGQNDFTHCAANDDAQNAKSQTFPTARTLFGPEGLWSDGTRLIVADGHNSRVVIWNTFPTGNFVPADLVLGQSDFTHNAQNDDNQDGNSDAQPSARTMGFPYMLDSDGTKLFLTDAPNNRVTVWNTIPTASFTPADVVLGQSDFAHYTPNDDNQDGSQDSQTSARTLYTPAGVYAYGGHLLVVDSNNSRMLIF